MPTRENVVKSPGVTIHCEPACSGWSSRLWAVIWFSPSPRGHLGHEHRHVHRATSSLALPFAGHAQQATQHLRRKNTRTLSTLPQSEHLRSAVLRVCTRPAVSHRDFTISHVTVYVRDQPNTSSVSWATSCPLQDSLLSVAK